MDDSITIQENSTNHDDNICQQCGGTIRIEYTMGFEQGYPMDLRSSPQTMLKLCPGHPNKTTTSTSDWGHLSNEQKYSVNKLRQRMQDHFAAEIEAFYTKHANLKLEWDFTLDAVLRDKEEQRGS